MKIYAIGYELLDGEYFYKIYISPYLESWQKIDGEFFNTLNLRYNIAGKDNDDIKGIYFNNI